MLLLLLRPFIDNIHVARFGDDATIHYIGGNIMRCTAARKLLTNIFVGFKTMPLKHLTMFHEPLKLSS